MQIQNFKIRPHLKTSSGAVRTRGFKLKPIRPFLAQGPPGSSAANLVLYSAVIMVIASPTAQPHCQRAGRLFAEFSQVDPNTPISALLPTSAPHKPIKLPPRDPQCSRFKRANFPTPRCKHYSCRNRHVVSFNVQRVPAISGNPSSDFEPRHNGLTSRWRAAQLGERGGLDEQEKIKRRTVFSYLYLWHYNTKITYVRLHPFRANHAANCTWPARHRSLASLRDQRDSAPASACHSARVAKRTRWQIALLVLRN